MEYDSSRHDTEDDGNKNAEKQEADDDLDDSIASRFFSAVLMPANPFIILSVPAVGVMLCQTAWIGGTYVPLPPPGPELLDGFVPYHKTHPHQGKMGPKGENENIRLLVIGDSLVLSIGCKDTENAHLLTQTMASQISKDVAVSLEWHSLGLNGASVDVIHEAAMDYLRRLNRQDSADARCIPDQAYFRTGAISKNRMTDQEPAGDPDEKWISSEKVASQQQKTGIQTLSLLQSQADVCIIFCGLNDFKRLWRGRTACAFRRDLKRFILELRREVGPSCLIFLPALPLEPTQFPEPLRTLVIYLGAVFDAQKERIASELPGVIYLAKPERAWWRRVHRDVGNVIAEDGVHPNEQGYAVYGRYLGSSVARHLALHS